MHGQKGSERADRGSNTNCAGQGIIDFLGPMLGGRSI